jgi:hypothetical protein
MVMNVMSHTDVRILQCGTIIACWILCAKPIDQRNLRPKTTSQRAEGTVKTSDQIRMEPTSGLEPLTCRLRIIVRSYRCSS